MAIKRRLKGYRDTSHFASIRKSRLDRSAAATKRRQKAKLHYRMNKGKIKISSKQRRLKMKPTEKLFNTRRAQFLKTYKPKLPPRPGAKPKSVFKPAVKAIKRAIKPIKKAIKTAIKRAYKPSRTTKRTGVKGR